MKVLENLAKIFDWTLNLLIIIACLILTFVTLIYKEALMSPEFPAKGAKDA